MTHHIVRMNETIDKISKTYLLDPVEIKELNKFINDWDHLIPGTKLRLPEISDDLNNELDQVEPFIEEYYPSLNKEAFIHEKKEESNKTEQFHEAAPNQEVNVTSDNTTQNQSVNEYKDIKKYQHPIPQQMTPNYPYYPYPYYPYLYNPNYPYYQRKIRRK